MYMKKSQPKSGKSLARREARSSGYYRLLRNPKPGRRKGPKRPGFGRGTVAQRISPLRSVYIEDGGETPLVTPCANS